MSWEKVKLGEVTESCLGKMLDQKKNKGSYKPYLANVNVRWGFFDLDNLRKCVSKMMRMRNMESNMEI